MNFQQRSYEKERMDAPDLSPEEFNKNLKEIVFINRYLGGANISWLGVKQIIDDHGLQQVKITDVGAGAGDAFAYFDQNNRHHQLQYEPLDIQPGAKYCADELFPHLSEKMKWHIGDYQALFETKNGTDIVMANLFCHHLTDDELVGFLVGAARYARHGIVINDLHRHPFAYYSIKYLTRFFSRSEFTKNDAPLSVRRGFTKKEWHLHLKRAGLSQYTLHWKWAFRHLIVIHTQDIEQ